MIPTFDPDTGYLPPGIHSAAWAEVPIRFGTNAHRLLLLEGLARALRSLARAGCRTVLLDGSFVSIKVLPNDYDAAWEIDGVDAEQLDPVFLDFQNQRAAMKFKFGGEFFPAVLAAAPGVAYREFFMHDRNGVPKGLIKLDPVSVL